MGESGSLHAMLTKIIMLTALFSAKVKWGNKRAPVRIVRGKGYGVPTARMMPEISKTPAQRMTNVDGEHG